MYVSESYDNTILSGFIRDRKYTHRCSGSSSNLNLTKFDLYAVVSSLAVSFAHFLIGSLKHILLWCLFFYFLHVVFVYDTHRLMSQTTLMKKNLTNFSLNPGQLVSSIPDWVNFCMA